MFSRRALSAVAKASLPVAKPAVNTKVAAALAQRASFSTGLVRPKPLSTSEAATSVPQTDNIAALVESLNAASKPSKITPTLEKFTLKNKVAVVTGGARGLGYNIAEALCDVDLKALVIFDVLKEHGDEAVAMLSKQFGIPVIFKQVDVRDHRSVQGAVDQVTTTLGKIDILVASAGIADSNIPAEGYDIEMFRRLIDINLTGTFVCAQAVGNAMIKQGSGGSMIFIASMSGHIVNFPQQQSCYNASKAGVIMLGKSLAAEWAAHSIRVNTISPGYMDTALNRVPALDAQKQMWKDRTPMNRLGNVDELNNLAVFLASDASTYMTGSDLLIDGGYCAW
ncbi:NAD(P)-binding protein [Wilcoxina mikolae CBS 423.85]|nr:NAD(P)-binding protein [Wilcoxina mikolae CBS 423.85]